MVCRGGKGESHLKHAKVLCLARGLADEVAESEAEQSQDDSQERWGCVGLVDGQWWLVLRAASVWVVQIHAGIDVVDGSCGPSPAAGARHQLLPSQPLC